MADVSHDIEQLELAEEYLQQAVEILNNLNLGNGDTYDQKCMEIAYSALFLIQGLIDFARHPTV